MGLAVVGGVEKKNIGEILWVGVGTNRNVRKGMKSVAHLEKRSHINALPDEGNRAA